MSLLEELVCSECLRPLVDGGDEFVCPACGIVREKQVIEVRRGLDKPSHTYKPSLGSYMGLPPLAEREGFARRISGSNSRFSYLKTLSDFTGRDGGVGSSCSKLVERVGEKLSLPRVVMDHAARIAKGVFENPPPHRRLTIAAVSAFSIISACRIEEVTSVSVKEVLDAHSDFGKPVPFSAIIAITLDSPMRARPRAPESYLSRVVARLSLNRRVLDRLEVAGVNPTAYFRVLRTTAEELLRKLGEEETAGRRPGALAASAVYSAETLVALIEDRRKRITQREVAECDDSAEYTIREHCARIFLPLVRSMAAQGKPVPVLASLE